MRCLPPLSLQASAWGCWILHNTAPSSIPTWLSRINPLPSFFRLTQRGRCCAVLLSDTSVGCTVASMPTKLHIPTRLQKRPVLPQHQQTMYLLFFFLKTLFKIVIKPRLNDIMITVLQEKCIKSRLLSMVSQLLGLAEVRQTFPHLLFRCLSRKMGPNACNFESYFCTYSSSNSTRPLLIHSIKII